MQLIINQKVNDMATEKVLIELTEEDLKTILCNMYNVEKRSAELSILQYDGDARDPSYTEIKLIGIKK